MKEDINVLIGNLSWDTNSDIQQKAIEKLSIINEKYINMLIRPVDKRFWENAALVLKKIGYPRNELAIPGLLEWLQDMNWPGAWIALETLQDIDILALLPYIENALKKAVAEDDEMWIMAIKELAINRLKIKATDFTNPELFEVFDRIE
jgi:hypothetical protein